METGQGNSHKPLIIITGPTASGKTQLSIEIAKAINGEIISADSMQVYRGMDIGTAKVRKDEMQGIKHYLIDEFEPWEEFNVVIFKEKCDQYIQEIYSHNKIPIIAGGTGFYIQAVLYNIDFKETATDEAYRKKLWHFASVHGAEALHKELSRIDKASSETIHPNNIKRVIRAMEYYNQTGKPISQHNEEERQKEAAYSFKYFVLNLPREILYNRINQRVDIMRKEGLEDEVRALMAKGCTKDMVSMQGLGYKEIIDAISNNTPVGDAFEKIKQETRHFAKRQVTWFKREKNTDWIEKEQFASEQELVNYCIKECNKITRPCG